MKKKILSSLVAACVIVTMALPGVTAAVSSKSSTDDKITSAKFDATNYVVANGDTLNLAEKFTAFCGTTAICEEPTTEYDLVNNDVNFAFSIDEDGLVSCQEDKGTAKVTISLNDGKVKATTTLTAKKAVVKKDATGFTVVVPAKLPIDAGAENQEIIIKPYPTGSAFTTPQLTAMVATGGGGLEIEAVTANADDAGKAGEVLVDLNGEDVTNDGASPAKATPNADGNVVLTVPNSGGTDLASADVVDTKAQEYKITIKVFGAGTAAVSKTFKTQGVKAVAATGAGAVKTTATIKVGETLDAATLFKPTPSGANVGLGKSITNDDADDFAAFYDGTKLKGYAVGKSKIACDIGGKVSYAIINVVETTAVTTAVPTVPEKLTVTVGSAVPLVATNYGDATVSWVFDDNGTIGLTNNNKTTTSVIGKKVGTSTIKATFSNGDVKTIAVTVTAAPAPAPDKAPGTTVPQTGDSLFANLFK